MKSKIITVSLILSILVLGGSFFFSQISGVLAGGPQSTDAAVSLEGTSATTSVTYLTTAGSASEKVFESSGWERFSIDTQFNASTTASIFVQKFYVSQNSNCDTTPSACDWFDLPNVTVDSAIANTVGSTTATYTFTPQTAGINRTSVLINPSDHKWFKVARSVTGANGSVWQQVTPTRGF